MPMRLRSVKFRLPNEEEVGEEKLEEEKAGARRLQRLPRQAAAETPGAPMLQQGRLRRWSTKLTRFRV
jgi:hypothetical protein